MIISKVFSVRKQVTLQVCVCARVYVCSGAVYKEPIQHYDYIITV